MHTHVHAYSGSMNIATHTLAHTHNGYTLDDLRMATCASAYINASLSSYDGHNGENVLIVATQLSGPGRTHANTIPRGLFAPALLQAS